MWQDATQSGIIRMGVSASADRVMVCGDCGYFLLFASQEALQKMRAHWNQLVPAI